MKDKYILSICIPSYNRDNYLKRLIESIINQKGFSYDIEICITDNNSNDNTENIIKEYQKKYLNIKYVKNNTNIGLLPNLLASINNGHGDYRRLFGSDDYMIEGSLYNVLAIIKKYNPNIILSEPVSSSSPIPHIHTGEGILYKNFADFDKIISKDFLVLGSNKECFFNFISVGIFKNKVLKDSAKVIKNKYGTEYLSSLQKHSFNRSVLMYTGIKDKNTNIFIANNSMVVNQINNTSWKYNLKIAHDFFDLIIKMTHNKSVSRRFRIFLLKQYIYLLKSGIIEKWRNQRSQL